jgi:hypothetical protein
MCLITYALIPQVNYLQETSLDFPNLHLWHYYMTKWFSFFIAHAPIHVFYFPSNTPQINFALFNQNSRTFS